MTSNLGGELIAENKKDEAIKDLTHVLKKEFINRIDEIVCFNQLSPKVIDQIIDKLLNDLSNRLAMQDICVSFTKDVKKYIQKSAYDPVFGARPIKRFIQKQIENLIAKAIVDNEIKKDKHYTVELVDGKKLSIVKQRLN